MIGIIAAALFFGSIAFIAVQASRAACTGVLPAPDGPRRGTPPDAVLIAAAALLGGLVVGLGATPTQIANRCARRLRACRLLVQRYALRHPAGRLHARSARPTARLCLDAAQLGTHLFRFRRLRAVRGGRGFFTRLWNGLGRCEARRDRRERRWAHHLQFSRYSLAAPLPLSAIGSPGGHAAPSRWRRTSQPLRPSQFHSACSTKVARLRNLRTGNIVAGDVEKANSLWRRFTGFLTYGKICPDRGLWFDNCSAIHTIGMRERIDAVFLAKDGRVMRINYSVAPNRLAVICARRARRHRTRGSAGAAARYSGRRSARAR